MRTAFRSGPAGLIGHLFAGGTCTGLSDARLLERFVTSGDEAAFTALVSRHGALVLNTCEAVLKDPNAAADAFQATFVLLFRKAGSVRGVDALGAWLHRVAYRVAIQARSDAARRREIETLAASTRAPELPGHDDTGPLLHEEIERLPERFRLPVVLCYLEGMSRDQAADHLKCTEGAVRGRLAKGRELLRQRLARRGVTLAVPCVSRAAIPESLVATTVRAAAGGVSATVGALIAVASHGCFMSRLKAVIAVVSVFGVAASALAYWSIRPGQPPGGKLAIRPAVVPTAQAGRAVGTQSSDNRTTMPVEGRILDLEGRPVVGASVSVTDFETHADGNLDVWIDELKRLGKKTSTRALPVVSSDRRAVFSATTGPDGRFRIEGLTRECFATASITGPGIETSHVHILTRDMPTFRAQVPMIVNGKNFGPMMTYYGARFDHVAAPTRPIVGTVRDKDTGSPIAGVSITGMPNIPNSLVPTPGVLATTNAQGRFQVDGLPVSRGFKLFTEVPAGQPYVNCGFVSPASEHKPGPFTFDLALKRGVLVRGRLTDKVTGEPLRAQVSYLAFGDNPHLDEYPNFKRESQLTYIVIPGPDGRFTIPALPGRGLIGVRADFNYLLGIGADAIKGLDERSGMYRTFPQSCFARGYHVLAEINPAPGTEKLTLELKADPGQTVTGTIADPDGRPLRDEVEIRRLDGLMVFSKEPTNHSTFVVSGLPSRRYRLDFFNRGRKLAGSITLRGDERGPLAVKLEPWGTVTGRVVDDDGNPRTDVEIYSTIPKWPDPERGMLPNKASVDARGRFRIEGLVSGVKYDAYGNSINASGAILDGLHVGPGEVKDLGDILLPTQTRNAGN
jgi:RNA polymerase sigma factor (sigma-70 family)